MPIHLSNMPDKNKDLARVHPYWHMRFFNLCEHDVSKSHSQRINSYMPIHVSYMSDKNKDLPEYIIIGTCGFSIYANMTFPKAIVNGSIATCPSMFPTCLIKTKICQSTSLLAHAVFQSTLYANMTFPKPQSTDQELHTHPSFQHA